MSSCDKTETNYQKAESEDERRHRTLSCGTREHVKQRHRQDENRDRQEN